MKTTVVIAAYNEQEHLPECTSTLLNQDGQIPEIIIVDDGSHKKIEKSDLKLKDPKSVTILRINHSGPAIARNLGVQRATGDIIVFVDGDMKFAPNFLKVLTKPIETGESKGTFSTEEFVANWDNVWARCWNYENGIKKNRRILPEQANMTKDFRAILKSEFTRVDGFDDTGYTDTWTLSKKLGYLPTPTKAKYYHYNPSSKQEVVMHSLWIGARQRKFGILGKIIAALRATAPFSLVIGILKAIKYREPKMIEFKLYYDLGTLGGIMYSITSSKN